MAGSMPAMTPLSSCTVLETINLSLGRCQRAPA
jgi:hypothetical protein